MALTRADLDRIDALVRRRLDERFAGEVGAPADNAGRVWEAIERLANQTQALAAAQERTEKRLEALAAQVATLAAAQERTEKRLEALAAQVATLAAAQERTEKAVQALTATVGGLKGHVLELMFVRKAHAYLGRLARGVREVALRDLEGALEEKLDPEELFDLMQVDTVLVGSPRQVDVDADVYWAVEVSSVVDRNDVARAARRAAALRKAGYPTVAVAAGEGMTEGAMSEAPRLGVLVLEDGIVRYADEALQFLR